MLTSQPKNNSTNNTLNSSNNSNVNTTVNQTSKVQNQTKSKYITEQQAINIYKKNEGDFGTGYRYIATFVTFEGKPYYTITIVNKKTGGSESAPSVVNAITGKLEGPD